MKRLRILKLIWPVLLFTVLFLHTTAQNNPNTGQATPITGTIRDENNNLLVNAGVSSKSTNTKVLTGNDGRFSISTVPGTTLVISIDGYNLREVKAKDKMEVLLTRKYLQATDSVVVLHDVQSVKKLIQSTSTIYTKQLVTTPAPLVLNALSGRLAGLYTQVTSGAPARDNEGILTRVRGQAPIILIDGVQRDFTSLDPESIESVSIYKDALSTVMLGQRSSGNIIHIITKKGAGAKKISATVQSAVQTPINMPRPLDAYNYALLYNEASGSNTYGPAVLEAYKNRSDPYRYPDVHWYDSILEKNTSLSRVNLNFEGASGRDVSYFVALDYLTNNGLFKTLDSNSNYNTNSFINRYIFRSNLAVNMSKTLKVSLNIFGRIQNGNQPGNLGSQNILNALVATPNNAYPIRNPNGSLGGNGNYTNNIFGQSVKAGYTTTYNRDVSIDLEAVQQLSFITSGLYIKVKGSFNSSLDYSTNRSKSFAVYNPTYNAAGQVTSYATIGVNGTQANAGSSNDRSRYEYFELTSGYDKNFGKHGFDFTVTANNQTNYLTTPATKFLPEIYTNYAGRLQYNYAEKYFIEGAASYSSYNRFMPGKRNGFFPAVGLGWNVANESFVKNQLGWLTNFKIRGSYGKTGRANVGYYVYRQYYFENANSNAFDYYFGVTPSGDRGFYDLALANPYSTWEKAKKLNLGLDIGIGKNLTATVEYFKDQYYDLMIQRGRNSTLIGNTYSNENRGAVNYTGTEFSLNYSNHIGGLNYFVSANGSFIKNRVVTLDEVTQPYEWNYLKGKPYNAPVGLIADGFFNTATELADPNIPKLEGYTARLGDLKYRDLNGDKIINTKDEGPIATMKPLFYYGFNAGIQFNGFDISVLLQGVQNNEILLTGNSEWEFQNGGRGQAYEQHLGRWTPSTATTATYPKLSIGTNVNNHRVSTFWLQKANYLRLKNAEVGYTFRVHISKKINLPSARAFVNGLNLLTFSSISRVDPETYGASYPIVRTLNAGLNIKF